MVPLQVMILLLMMEMIKMSQLKYYLTVIVARMERQSLLPKANHREPNLNSNLNQVSM